MELKLQINKAEREKDIKTLEEIKENAEVGFEGEIAGLAKAALDRLHGKVEDAEKTPDHVVEKLGEEKLEEVTAEVDKEIEALKEKTEGEIEAVKKETEEKVEISREKIFPKEAFEVSERVREITKVLRLIFPEYDGNNMKEVFLNAPKELDFLSPITLSFDENINNAKKMSQLNDIGGFTRYIVDFLKNKNEQDLEKTDLFKKQLEKGNGTDEYWKAKDTIKEIVKNKDLILKTLDLSYDGLRDMRELINKDVL